MLAVIVQHLGGKDVAPVLVSLAAFIVSGVGLIVSFATYYFNVYKRPHLNLLAGKQSLLGYRPGHKVAFDLDLVIFNEGARAGAIVELSGTLFRRDGKQRESSHSVEFEWDLFMVDTNVAPPGEPSKPWRDTEGRVVPLHVPSHAAIVKQIRFCTKIPLRLSAGAYRVELIGVVYPSQRKPPQLGCTLHLTADQIAVLEADPPDLPTRRFVRPQLEVINS